MQDDQKKRRTKIILCLLCGIFAVAAITAGVYLLWEKPPELAALPESTAKPIAARKTGADDDITAEPSPEPTEVLEDGEAILTTRQDGTYTFLLAGKDEAGGNTDTIMVGKLDTRDHTLNIVSIPRDTLVNVEWMVRKINAAYAGAGGGEDGVEALKQQVSRLLGFNVDCYAIIDIQVLIDAVNAIGGIDFDVPQQMYYDGGPVIYLEPGYQHLDGEQVLGLLRFRSGYTTGDLGRLDMQHTFLKAVAEQFIDLGNVPNAGKLLKILSNGLMTDLAPANIAYFMRQAISCDSEDIHFYTMPNNPVYLNDLSYVTVEISDWLKLVNECLNPYDEQVGYGNVDIVYRNWDGTYHGTAGLRGSWYYPTAEDIARAKAEAEAAAKAAAEEAETPPEPTEPPEETPEETPSAEYAYELPPEETFA